MFKEFVIKWWIALVIVGVLLMFVALGLSIYYQKSDERGALIGAIISFVLGGLIVLGTSLTRGHDKMFTQLEDHEE